MLTTSQEALRAIRPEVAELQRLCAEAIRLAGPLTADEVAAALGRSVLAIRPRMTELRQAGTIIATGQRRTNDSGRSANVWKLKETA
jgi:predicted ArsR family transcriptional regulator